MSGTSPLALSDEDFMKLPEPVGAPVVLDAVDNQTATAAAEKAAADEAAAAEAAKDPVVVEEEALGDDKPKADEGSAANPKDGVDKDAAEQKDKTPAGEGANVAEPGAKSVAEEKAATAGDKDGTKADAEEPPTVEALAGFYNKIMTPFKANGKTIELKSPDEAIALMQMGANYTKKMQELQPHKKLLLMLQNNGLLDEGKLSFLIDVERKDPEAIKKLIKDSGVDPLDIDTNTEPQYIAGSHTVTESEVLFRSKLEDISSTPGGPEMISEIDRTWDKASKEALWENPEVLSIIQEQRESGVFGKITVEMDRQKTLGKIPLSTPFLQAYRTVGDEMVKANAFADLPGAKDPAGVSPPKVLATRTAAVKAAVTNGDKAGAAAGVRTASSKAESKVNYLTMSDDEFIKTTMAGRV